MAYKRPKNDLAFAKHKFRCGRGRSGTRLDKNGDLILFRLTFDEWYKIWLDSGHWHERGNSKGKYVMSRKDDIGHYEPGNVFIQLHEENVRQGHVGRTHSDETKEKISNTKKGRPSHEWTAESLKKLSDSVKLARSKKHWSNKGFKMSDETKTKLSLTALSRKKIKCCHCGKEAQPNNFSRWHGDNCKMKENI